MIVLLPQSFTHTNFQYLAETDRFSRPSIIGPDSTGSMKLLISYLDNTKTLTVLKPEVCVILSFLSAY